MDAIGYGCRYCVLALFEDHQEVAFGLSVIHSHRKLVEQLGDAFLVDVFESAVEHEIDQVVDYPAVFAEVEEGLQALGLEGLEVGVLQSSHSLDHVLPDLDGRRKGFWVAAKDEPEVYV